jgi:hypothetical protein
MFGPIQDPKDRAIIDIDTYICRLVIVAYIRHRIEKGRRLESFDSFSLLISDEAESAEKMLMLRISQSNSV